MTLVDGTIIGYSWNLYYGGALLHEDDEVFDTEEEAREAGEEAIDDKIAEWTLDRAWHDYDKREDFDVYLVAVVEDEEGEEYEV